ncbi:MAG: RNA polymerase sigma factor RpoH [Gammaproteobacteria bacterium]|jgi:RNA polymerase sigma-32 factor|nr:RNA polymerase sigma factor RpoH [Gammaproteobacteria bacterium]MBT4462543.1 RNA polymerase sigma factor RpoH [Gammaproteobacteria bacterium]MBT5116825.1 RNA polymerase sigma factor RpoH [Gammaproteobacteria bacterium]MBT5761663.1 RNA polymerase sigma factor RpoH [Gammaproteobacteria bacterium]MBT7322487.1 RNA polymerase sigma factor RpoH [Gammaproteobacteria bacterium]
MSNILMENLPAELSLGLESGDSLDIYLNQLRKTPLLSREEEISLFKKLNSSDDLDAARKLVLAHLRFVVHVAKTYKGYGLPLLDLIQEGNIGLMKAVKRFDPDKKVRLLSFAIYWIRAEIHEFVIKNWRMVKVATTKAQRKLFFKLKSKKTHTSWLTETEKKDIANELDVKPETVTQMESRLSGKDVSFDPSDDDEISPATYMSNNDLNPLEKLEYETECSDSLHRLENAMSKLDDRSKDIISQRYLLDNKSTLNDLSKKYNISKERIRQIESKSLSLLKDTILLA